MNGLLIAIGLAFMAGCMPPPPPSNPVDFTPISLDRLHPDIRRSISDPESWLLSGCGNLVHTMKKYIGGGSSNFYDNRTGQVIAVCDFWFCSKNNEYCSTHCPPATWKCSLPVGF